MDTTIIYYTANTEKEYLERKVRETILKNSGGLPIISISRKPIDFGENICVGEQPVNYANLNRQLLIGLKTAKTRFALATESDTFYPPEYFNFIPPIENHVFHYTNVYSLYTWHSKRYYGLFWKKFMSCAARICGCEYWISQIERLLDPKDWNLDVKDGPVFPDILQFKYSWKSINPVLTLKTSNNLSRYTSHRKKPENPINYWGYAEKILEEFGE